MNEIRKARTPEGRACEVTSAAYVAAGKTLLALAQRQTIPYTAGGMSLVGMDCQGLCEFLLIDCGVPQSECDLKGSNAHWRACLWTGTPEECVAAFGCVPPGAWIFIVDDGGGEVARGYTDGLGDAQHMGVYLGGGVALHASAKRGCVAQSDFAEKTVPNGGWNAVGLCPWVEYGVTSEGSAAGDSGQEDAMDEDVPVYESMAEAQAAVPVQGSPYVKYVRIVSPNEYDVKIRERPKKGAITKFSAKAGSMYPYQGERDGYYKILFAGKARYVLKEFGQLVKVRKG